MIQYGIDPSDYEYDLRDHLPFKNQDDEESPEKKAYRQAITKQVSREFFSLLHSGKIKPHVAAAITKNPLLMEALKRKKKDG